SIIRRSTYEMFLSLEFRRVLFRSTPHGSSNIGSRVARLASRLVTRCLMNHEGFLRRTTARLVSGFTDCLQSVQSGVERRGGALRSEERGVGGCGGVGS